jgi:RNA polymerase sigma-70 factor, ECF subfamily
MIIEQEDMSLIRNILNGNRQAEETFFNKYSKIVRDFIRSKFNKYNLDDIDDWVADIMIKVFQNISKYDPQKSSIKTWILVITKNYLTDVYRSSANITFTSTDYDYVQSITNSAIQYNCNNYSSSCHFENTNAINYISTQLTPNDFMLLDMKYVQGYNYKEIGSEFQLTSSTVSNKINYIKTKLKKEMPEDIFK